MFGLLDGGSFSTCLYESKCEASSASLIFGTHRQNDMCTPGNKKKYPFVRALFKDLLGYLNLDKKLYYKVNFYRKLLLVYADGKSNNIR